MFLDLTEVDEWVVVKGVTSLTVPSPEGGEWPVPVPPNGYVKLGRSGEVAVRPSPLSLGYWRNGSWLNGDVILGMLAMWGLVLLAKWAGYLA